MVVESVGVHGFRNLADCEVELGPGVNLLWGANGAGKTNLLEATYMALAGRSCRTRDDRETIVFGEPLARAEATVASRVAAPPLPQLGQPHRGPAPTRRRRARRAPRQPSCARRSPCSCPTAWR